MKRNQTYHQTFFYEREKECALAHSRAERVACDMFLLRASAHHWHVSAFLCNREFQGISYYIKGLSPSPFLSLTLFHVLSKLLFLFKMSYMFLYIG